MFYLAVVLEKGQIVDRGLDPEYEAELVVQLDGNRPHRMFDPRSFEADMETVAHLAFILRVQLASEECGDVVRLDRMDRGTRQILVNGRQVRLFTEDDIGGVFALIHTPVVSGCEVPIDRTTLPGQFVQPSVDAFGVPAVGEALCPLPVRDVRKGVVGHPIVDAELAQLARQPVMTVKANLKPTGQPSWYPHMAQAEFFVYEIEVIMQTLAGIRHQVRWAGLLIVPRLVG